MTLKELIQKAYDLAQEVNEHGHNTRYTYQEAIQYDPLVSVLHEALDKLK